LDRHDNLEYGKIKIDGIIQIIRFAKKLEIPLILETPYIHIEDDIKILDIYTLKTPILSNITQT
jgi:endonuclease IV